MCSSKINRTRLRTAVLILFLLQTLMLPAAIGVTYASRSLKPEHILTYSAGRLVWDAGTDTDSSGAARLRLFDTAYSHVDSGDGAEVVAPGTEGHSLVRLKNDGGSAVTYTAVLYRIRTENVPVQAALEGEGFADTEQYALPENAARENVLRAVTPPEDVLGRVIAVIPGAGGAVRFLRTPLGMLCLVLVLPLAIRLPEMLGRRRVKEA